GDGGYADRRGLVENGSERGELAEWRRHHPEKRENQNRATEGASLRSFQNPLPERLLHHLAASGALLGPVNGRRHGTSLTYLEADGTSCVPEPADTSPGDLWRSSSAKRTVMPAPAVRLLPSRPARPLHLAVASGNRRLGRVTPEAASTGFSNRACGASARAGLGVLGNGSGVVLGHEERAGQHRLATAHGVAIDEVEPDHVDGLIAFDKGLLVDRPLQLAILDQRN